MNRLIAPFIGILAFVGVADAAVAGDRCVRDNMTTQTQIPATVVDGSGTAPPTPIPPAQPATGG